MLERIESTSANSFQNEDGINSTILQLKAKVILLRLPCPTWPLIQKTSEGQWGIEKRQTDTKERWDTILWWRNNDPELPQHVYYIDFIIKRLFVREFQYSRQTGRSQ